MFKDRYEAGLKLAEKLKEYENSDSVIVALPRGGIPVAAVIAEKLHIPMDIFFVKKIPSPYNEEAAIGAVSENGFVYVNEHAKIMLNVADEYIKERAEQKMREMKEKRALYGKKRINLKDKTVIIVDDGIATGASMLLATDALREEGAKKIVIAAPVAPPDVVSKLEKSADEVVILQTPPDFMAVGQFYYDFHQLSDDEVLDILKKFK
ncbi:phosphoribosyltransferase [Nitrosophilus alvini]|uniref:phosphoribosyltransferase n=1 Tax=Nitrosophilus alvini TaxID=2714855 RepID=UPI001F41802D|nr:phosphoribosyltransferase [Nitrosophilus alvini]